VTFRIKGKGGIRARSHFCLTCEEEGKEAIYHLGDFFLCCEEGKNPIDANNRATRRRRKKEEGREKESCVRALFLVHPLFDLSLVRRGRSCLSFPLGSTRRKREERERTNIIVVLLSHLSWTRGEGKGEETGTDLLLYRVADFREKRRARMRVFRYADGR